MKHRLLAGGVLAAGLIAASSTPAHAAVTATFANGTLSVTGDSLDNNITISRNAAGNILVNGGAVSVTGGTPTVANTVADQGLRPRRQRRRSRSARPTARCPRRTCSAAPATTC